VDQPREYRSFLVRLWREVGADGSDHWCGEVEQIQSGQLRPFTSFDELLILLRPADSPNQQARAGWRAPEEATGDTL
jgi:hypothetical protein